jgi:hypothetical protein
MAAALIAAGAVKCIGVADAAIWPHEITAGWWLTVAESVGEIVLGCWLLYGFWPVMAHGTAVAVFTLFAIVAGAKAVQGEASCGCLGSVELNPWLTLVFDVGVVGLAVTFRPRVTDSRRPVSWSAFAAVGAFAVGLVAWVYSSATELPRGIVIPAVHHEFGPVRQGESLTHTFEVVNTCSFPVELT